MSNNSSIIINKPISDNSISLSGIWDFVCEKSKSKISSCSFNDSKRGHILFNDACSKINNISINDNKNIRNSIGILAINNSKINWNNQHKSNKYIPSIVTDKNSFFNFPELNENTGNIRMCDLIINTESSGNLDSEYIKFVSADGIETSFKNVKISQRLINNGLQYLLDERCSNIIYPENIESYNIVIDEIHSSASRLNAELELLQKDLRGKTIKLNINNDFAGNIIIKNFYNGTIEISINNDINTAGGITLLNLENVNIYSNNKIISNNIRTIEDKLMLGNGYIFNIENVKAVHIYDIIFINAEDYNQENIQISNFNFGTYKYEMLTHFINNKLSLIDDTTIKNKKVNWCIPLYIKSSNVIIENCQFKNTYISILGAYNSKITSKNNKFYQVICNINSIPMRQICFYITHNTLLDDVNSEYVYLNDSKLPLDYITIFNKQFRNKTISFINCIECPGSIYNHNHTKVIPTLSEIDKTAHQNRYMPVGSQIIMPTLYNFANEHVNVSSVSSTSFGFGGYNEKLGFCGNINQKLNDNNISDYILTIQTTFKFLSKTYKMMPSYTSIINNWLANRTFENNHLFNTLLFSNNMLYAKNKTNLTDDSYVLVSPATHTFFENINNSSQNYVRNSITNFINYNLIYNQSSENIINNNIEEINRNVK